jgi:hypothetical protein
VAGTSFFLRPGGCHLFPFSLDTSIAAAAAAGALLAVSGGGKRRDAAAGACVLAALMARPEMGLVVAAALVAQAMLAPGEPGPAGRRLLLVAGAPAMLAALLYAAVSWGTPLATLRSEGWLALLGPPGSFRNIYRAYAGLDLPGVRLAELLLAAILLLLILALIVLASFLARGSGKVAANVAALLVGILLAAAAAFLLWPGEAWRESVSLLPPLVRLVPPLVLAAAAARAWRRIRRREEAREDAVPDAMLWVAAYFSARMVLVAGYFGPYNAFLLPLSLLCALAIAASLLRRLEGRAGPALPRIAAAALGVFVAFRLADTGAVFRRGAWSAVTTEAGTVVLPEPVAGATRAALADLRQHLPPGRRLVGFPEGGFFTWSLGLVNPLPQEQFFPGHLDAAEERRTIARLTAEPPDAILMANVLAVGHLARVFGNDYLGELDRTLHERFVPAASYGPGAGPEAAIGDPQFFLEIRVPAPPP